MPLKAPGFTAYWRLFFKLLCLVLLVVAANWAIGWVVDALEMQVQPSNEDLVHRMIMVSAVAYALLLAIPFVPGVEIGLSLIAMLGPKIVGLVYLCTLVGLSISFFVGRLVPLASLSRLLEDLQLRKASGLLDTIAPMAMDQRLAFLVAKAPHRMVPFLLRHRYIALALLVNLPGNIVIGGGGGIALLAGASRLYSLPGFLITIALAVAPLPLAVLFFGREVLAG